MTDKIILMKIIKKAEHNGYYSIISEYECKKGHIEDLILFDGEVNNYWEVSIRDTIFSHEFAKALWGSHRVNYCISEYGNKQFRMKDTNGAFDMPSWQWHLQQMVLEENPLKYLEQFIKE